MRKKKIIPHAPKVVLAFSNWLDVLADSKYQKTLPNTRLAK